MKQLAKLKEWLTIDDAAKFLSMSLAEEVGRTDVLQLGLDGHLTLSAYFVNFAHGRYASDVGVKDAPVFVLGNPERHKGKGFPKRYGSYENASAVPEEVQSLVASGECIIGISGDAYRATDGSTRVLVTEKSDCLRTLRGVWDLTMIGAERLDVEREIQQLTGGPEVTLVANDGVVLRNGEQFAILYERFSEEQIKTFEEKYGEKRKWADLRNWFPAGGLAVVDHALVVRTRRLTALIDKLSESRQLAEVREARLSDPRLKVIAALIEKAGISLSEPRGQAAELKRLVDATGYGPVSPDLCEKMVNSIKDRMPDWD